MWSIRGPFLIVKDINGYEPLMLKIYRLEHLMPRARLTAEMVDGVIEIVDRPQVLVSLKILSH